jgi:hypothetical protein
VRLERVSSTSHANLKENPGVAVGMSLALRSRARPSVQGLFEEESLKCTNQMTRSAISFATYARAATKPLRPSHPTAAGRMLTAAPCFQPFHRGVLKVRLHQARPKSHMLIQRRLRANEERSLNGRDSGSHQKLLCTSVPQRDDADTHTFSDRSAK